jgi:hypothetical protein
LSQSSKEFSELAEELNGSGRRNAMAVSSVALPFDFFGKLNSEFALAVFGMPLLLDFICFRLTFHLVYPSLLFINVDIEVFVGFLDPILPKELQKYNIILFYALANSKTMAVETVHPQ